MCCWIFVNHVKMHCYDSYNKMFNDQQLERRYMQDFWTEYSKKKKEELQPNTENNVGGDITVMSHMSGDK